MNILITTQYFYPENFRINDFAFRMVQRGHNVSVLTGIPNYPAGKPFGSYRLLREEIVRGVTVYRVPLIPRGKSRSINLALNYMSFLISALVFGPWLLRKVKADLIFSVNYSPATVGLIGVRFSSLKKARLALWVQDLWPQSLVATGAIKSERVLKVVDRMVRWIYKRSDHVFVQSKAFSESLASTDAVDPNKVKYFPNWAEDTYGENFVLKDKVVANLIPPAKFKIMFAGNLGVAQSLSTIVQAALEIKHLPIHWVFLGDGREKEWLEREVAKLGLQQCVSILGRYPLDTMPAFFSSADAMLVTLKKDRVFADTIPGKIQSYLKSGKPILSALDGEGASVVSESGAGINVAAEDFKGLAEAAYRMSVMSDDALNEMRLNAKNYYKRNFDVDLLLDEFEAELRLD